MTSLDFFREVEVADGVGDLGEGIGEPFEMFEKEDMSDMFKRAMLEKMGLVGESSFKVTLNPIRAGGLNQPALFSDGYFSMKKGVWRSKIS